MIKNKNISFPLAVLIIILLGSGLIGGFLFYQEKVFEEENLSVEKKEDVESETEERIVDLKTYTNEEIGIEFKYPPEWQDISFRKEINSIGEWPGTLFFTGSVGTEGLLRISIVSGDYRQFVSPILNDEMIDVDWSISEFAEKMNLREENIFFVKKLSEKSILVAFYYNIECSPYLSLFVLTPFKRSYPNFEIIIDDSFWEDDPILEEQEKVEMEEHGNACDLSVAHREIAEKIYNGNYSEELNNYITTAQLIADSVISSTRETYQVQWVPMWAEEKKMIIFDETEEHGGKALKEGYDEPLLLVKGYEETREEIEVRDCKEYFSAIEKGFGPSTTYAKSYLGYFEQHCLVPKWLTIATGSNVSYLDNFVLTEDSFKKLPASVEPVCGMDYSLLKKGLTWGEYNEEIKFIEKKDDFTLSLEDDTTWYSISIIGRGDFNQDEIEDLLMKTYCRAKGGSLSEVDYLIMTRLGYGRPLIYLGEAWNVVDLEKNE